MRAWLRTMLRIVSGVLDELSDQNAYRRHLTAHGAVHSPEQWRLFQDERADAQARRPRCC